MAEIRAFVAIEVEQAIKDRLAALQQELRRTGAAVSWVRSEGMHLTLKFLGDVAQERLPGISEALRQIALQQAPIPVTVIGTGAFPNLSRPRVIWAGIGEGAEVLCVLAGAVEDALSALRFPREARPFSPHLTLGRVKSPDGLAQLTPLVRAHADELFGAMTATEIRLMRSDLSPQGARYTVLSASPLRGA